MYRITILCKRQSPSPQPKWTPRKFLRPPRKATNPMYFQAPPIAGGTGLESNSMGTSLTEKTVSVVGGFLAMLLLIGVTFLSASCIN